MKKANQNQRRLWILSVISSFFAAVFLLTDRHLAVFTAQTMLEAMHGDQINMFCCLLLCVPFFRLVYGTPGRRERRFAMVGGLVLALCDFAGFRIHFFDALIPAPFNLFTLAADLFWLTGAFLMFSGILHLLFVFVMQHPVRQTAWKRTDRWLGSGLRGFLFPFGCLMAISLCLQVLYYPGLTSWDSLFQIAEGLKVFPLSDAHPFLHTLMMKYVIALGRLLFGSVAAGIAFYTLFQSMVMALSVCLCLRYMAKRGIHPGFRLAAFLYFAFQPAIALYSITLWKDVWLSYAILLYVLLLTEAVVNPADFFRGSRHMVLLFFSVLAFLFSKNTGIVVLIGTLPFLFLFAGKHRKKLGAVFLLVLCVLGFVRMYVIPHFGIAPGLMQDPFSAPLQQIARTCVHNGDSLTPEQRETVGEILPYDRLPEFYQPFIADSVKDRLNQEAFAQDPMKYAALWLRLGLEHPYTYLESFLAGSCGYWYPGVNYWIIEDNNYFKGMLMDGTWDFQDPDAGRPGYGVSPRHDALRHYCTHLFFLLQTAPGFATLLSAAFAFWMEFLLFLICLLKKKYRMLVPLAAMLTVWLTCIFSPVLAEYRYAFPSVVCLPVLTAFVLQDDLNLKKSL